MNLFKSNENMGNQLFYFLIIGNVRLLHKQCNDLTNKPLHAPKYHNNMYKKIRIINMV